MTAQSRAWWRWWLRPPTSPTVVEIGRTGPSEARPKRPARRPISPTPRPVRPDPDDAA